MGNLLAHVVHLSETIGPRPAATDAEEQAAHYISDAFEARGLEPQMQHIDTPRSSGGAFAIYHVLTIAAALLSRGSALPALLLGAVVAILMWLDLDTRWGLTSLMPKGPSQNVIAKHVPHSGRNERVTRVVVVAHYDSARTSIATSPAMVRNYGLFAAITKGATIAIPALVLVRMALATLPFGKVLEPWGWYITLVPAVYLLMPLLVAVQSELFARFSPGANDNASGVAALLGVLEKLVPEPETPISMSRDAVIPMTRSDAGEPEPDLDMMPPGSLLNYSPVAAPAGRNDAWIDDDDISWDTGVISGQTALGLDARRADPAPAPAPAPAPKPGSYAAAAAAPTSSAPDDLDPEDERSLRLFGAPAWKPPAHTPAPTSAAPVNSSGPDTGPLDFGDIDVDFGGETAPFARLGETGGEPAPIADPASSPASETRRGLFGGRANADVERHGVRDWLGVGNDFDARKKGKDIGSWDNFEDDDDAGWKGGAASVEDPSDPGYTASIAARIRRKVTMSVDRELSEKEVWFVATGAEETAQAGMKAFLDEYGHELKDAVIINLDNIGIGSVAYVTREGAARHYDADRRLVGASRRAVREADLAVKGREYRGVATDATAALARGYRAMSVMAFDINGRLPNWHWANDTAEAISEDNLVTAVELVSAIIKGL